MACLTLPDFDKELQRRLLRQAAANSRTTEEEACPILRTALYRQPLEQDDLASAIRAKFALLGGGELEAPPHSPMDSPPRLDCGVWMIFLDAIIISELMSFNPSSSVVAWVAGPAVSDLYLSTVSESDFCAMFRFCRLVREEFIR